MSQATTTSDTKPCPFCGEAIKVVAVKCKHCRSYVGDHVDPEVRAAQEAKAAEALVKPEAEAGPARAPAPAHRPEPTGFVNCLVCRNRYLASAESCDKCGALKGQNFVLAPGASAPSSTNRSTDRSGNRALFLVGAFVALALLATAVAILGFAAEKSAIAAIVIIGVVIALAKLA